MKRSILVGLVAFGLAACGGAPEEAVVEEVAPAAEVAVPAEGITATAAPAAE